jgi:hypothetical protein
LMEMATGTSRAHWGFVVAKSPRQVVSNSGQGQCLQELEVGFSSRQPWFQRSFLKVPVECSWQLGWHKDCWAGCLADSPSIKAAGTPERV